MDKQRTVLIFAGLSVASFLVALACLLFANALGGFSFLGATAAIFSGLICANRFSVLRRAPEPVEPEPRVVATKAKAEPAPESTRGRPMPENLDDHKDEDEEVEKDDEDDELQAQLAALRAATRAKAPLPPMSAAFLTPAAPPVAVASAAPTAMPVPIRPEPDLAVEVIEEPLEASVAEQFAAFRSEPVQPVADVLSPAAMRQMDELRAEIARLREDAKLRHATSAARARPAHEDAQAPLPLHSSRQPLEPAASPDAFARTEFSGLPGAPGSRKPAEPEHEQAYARTELSGLSPTPSEGSPFARTEYLTPVDLKR